MHPATQAAATPEQLRRQADRLRADAVYADGRAHYDLRAQADRLEAEARRLEQAANPTT